MVVARQSSKPKIFNVYQQMDETLKHMTNSEILGKSIPNNERHQQETAAT